MKVLMVHNAYVHRGGEDVCVERETMALREAGIQIEPFIVKNTAGFQTALHALEAPWGMGLEKTLETRLKEFQPNLIHVHNLFPALSPRLFKCAKKLGVRVILTLHNYRPLCLNGLFRTPKGELCERCAPGSYTPGIVRGCYRDSRLQSAALATHLAYARQADWYKDVDAFIAPCHFLKERFLHYGWTTDDRLNVQGHFLPELPETPIQPPEPYILYLGRLSEEKGVRWLLDAFSSLPDSGLKLVIGGDGPLKPLVQNMVHPQIQYVGYLETTEKTRWLSNASALVLPSLCYENFPLAALEANAWGIPLVVSRLGGLAELVETGVNGISFTAGHVKEFGIALEKLKRWTSNVARDACRAFVQERFSKERFLSRRLALYEKVCGINGNTPIMKLPSVQAADGGPFSDGHRNN